MLLSFDIGNETTEEQLLFVTTTLDQYGANATFFATGTFIEEHPALIRDLAARFEVACRSMTAPRLPEVNETRLRDELVGCKEALERVRGEDVTGRLGFRAPHNLVDERTFALLPELGYAYDASAYENLGLFFPPPTLPEQGVSSFGPVPIPWLFTLGDLGYFLARQDEDEVVSVAFDPERVASHRGAFQYLVSSYADSGAEFLTHTHAVG